MNIFIQCSITAYVAVTCCNQRPGRNKGSVTYRL